MAPARRAALPRKLLDNASRADSHTPAERFVLEQKVPKAAASWFLSVRAMVCVFLTKGLKSCKQRLQDLQGVSTHLQAAQWKGCRRSEGKFADIDDFSAFTTYGRQCSSCSTAEMQDVDLGVVTGRNCWWLGLHQKHL